MRCENKDLGACFAHARTDPFDSPYEHLNGAIGAMSHLTSEAESTATSAANDSVNRDNPHNTAAAGPRPVRVSLMRSARRAVPPMLVIGVLLALGYWGHHTDWRVPTFSDLTGVAAVAPDDWCDEHDVPESQCIECTPAKFPEYPKPETGQWCAEHGVHLCPLHHPEIAQLKQAPQITKADLDRAQHALELRPRPENNQACTFYRRRIQFASHEAVLKAGIDVEPVVCEPIVEAIQVVGEIRYDETRQARLSSRAAGTVWRVEKQLGDRVRASDVLAVIDAVQVGQSKADLLSALADEQLYAAAHKRLGGLAESGAIAAKQLLEVEAALRRARSAVLSAQQTLTNLGLPVDLDELRGLTDQESADRLRLLGIPDNIRAGLDQGALTSNLLPLRAPLDGEVVLRNVVAGEVVDTSRVLFDIANTGQLWLMLNVPVEETRYLRVGQRARFRPDNGELAEGTISWISTTADSQTRMVQVRADLPNPDGRLRNETFGAGQIVLREEREAIVVPNTAVQWDGSCHVVFVRDKRYFDADAPKVFHVRSVRPGAKTEKVTELIVGVLPGEVVATIGADVLRSQLLKSNLGAG